MATSRLLGRRGDGSAVVRGWVALYTLGLPEPMKLRRRDEVAGDLADEALDAVRRGESEGLRRRRLARWALGIPSDLAWRFLDAPATAARIRLASPPGTWVPLSRWSLTLLAVVGIGAAGAMALVLRGLVSDPAPAWVGWGPYGFVSACALVLLAVTLAIPWPGRAATLGFPAVLLGMAAAPWLWGCWFLALFALLLRRHQATTGGWSR